MPGAQRFPPRRTAGCRVQRGRLIHVEAITVPDATRVCSYCHAAVHRADLRQHERACEGIERGLRDPASMVGWRADPNYRPTARLTR